MGGFVDPGNRMPDQPRPQPLHKLDWIEWEGLRVINDAMEFANRASDPDLLPEDQQRIRDQLRNIVEHIQTFLPAE